MKDSQTLKKIGYAQRTIILLILIKILLASLLGVFAPLLVLPISFILGLIVIKNIWSLSSGLGSPVVLSVLCCILAFVPLLGLIALVVLNICAGKVLSQAGLHVGFLGVSKRDLDQLD